MASRVLQQCAVPIYSSFGSLTCGWKVKKERFFLLLLLTFYNYSNSLQKNNHNSVNFLAETLASPVKSARDASYAVLSDYLKERVLSVGDDGDGFCFFVCY